MPERKERDRDAAPRSAAARAVNDPVSRRKFMALTGGSAAAFLAACSSDGDSTSIKSKEVLGAAGSIVQVEARHAAAIRLQSEEEPAPEAFDPSLDEAQALKAVEPFIA